MIPVLPSHKPDPHLSLALQKSIEAMHEEQAELLQLMIKAKEQHGDLPETTPVFFGDVELPYCSPAHLEVIPTFVESYCKHILGDLEQAKTLEQQESILLEEMRQLLELSIVGGANRLQATSAIQTLAFIFAEYKKAAAHMPEEMEDVAARVVYYAQIVFDSMECSEGLTYRMQRKNGVPDERMYRTPFALALHSNSKHLSVAGETLQQPDLERVTAKARSLLEDICEDYAAAMPIPMPADALGLILRCTEKLGEIELRKAGPIRGRANDNAPQETEFLLDEPLIRRRVNHILGQVFLKHCDAARSPKSIMDAAQALEDSILLEERRSGIDR